MIVKKIVISFCNKIRHFSMYYEINKRGGGILFVDGRIFKIDKRGLHVYYIKS